MPLCFRQIKRLITMTYSIKNAYKNFKIDSSINATQDNSLTKKDFNMIDNTPKNTCFSKSRKAFNLLSALLLSTTLVMGCDESQINESGMTSQSDGTLLSSGEHTPKDPTATQVDSNDPMPFQNNTDSTNNHVSEPVDEIEEPVDEIEEPVDEIEEPVDEIEEPVDEIDEPMDEIEEPDPNLMPGGSHDAYSAVYLNDEGCLHLSNPTGPGLQVCGAWSFDGATQTFTALGDLSVQTPVGAFDLIDVDVTARRAPVELMGTAKVPFPSIGFLKDAQLEGDAPQATIALAHGETLETIEINGVEMETNPEHYYLVVDYDTGMSLNFGRIGLSTPGQGSTLVIAPEEPLVYVSGDLAGMLTGGLIDDAAIGFSLAGRLLFETQNELFDGQTWATRTVEGHLFLQGGLQLGAYPVHVSGAAVIDVDADDDGLTIFENGEDDLRLAIDGNVALGYDKAGFNLTLDVGTASVFYDGSVGTPGEMYVFAESSVNPFEGTVLEALALEQGHTMFGYWHDTDDFLINLSAQNTLLGPFTMRDLSVELDSEGVSVAGELGVLPLDVLGRQAVAFQGDFHSDGSFLMTGSAEMTIADFTIANTSLSLSSAGLSGAGVMSLPGLGEAQMSGSIQATGEASLMGQADLSPLGLTIAGASVNVNQSGAQISGRLVLPALGHANVSGEADARGRFNLSGEAQLAPLGLELAQGWAQVTQSSATIGGQLETPLSDITVEGSVSDAGFSLAGSTQINIPVRGPTRELQYVVDGAICGYEIVQSATECGVELVSDAAMCGVSTVTDAVECGTEVITSAARCGTEYVKDGFRCGTEFVTDAALCGTRVVTDIAICGGETVIDWACRAACFFGGCSCRSTRPKSCRIANRCEVAKSCNVAKSCDVAKSCNIANSCEIDATCEIELGCDTEVEIPDVHLGDFRGEVNVTIDTQSGAGGSLRGEYCLPAGGGCIPLAGGSVSLSGDPEACITVPGVGDVCAPF
jgi:hypothetical protein